jgi:GAF domain-containing protein
MKTLQRAIESLLLATDASRAMLQLARPNGEFAIEAEAVQHAQQQIRHGSDAGAYNVQAVESLLRDKEVLVEHDVGQASTPGSDRIRARMLAPLVRGGQLIGVIVLHRFSETEWSTQDKDAMLDAKAKIFDALADKHGWERPALEDLRSAAAQAILDRVRLALDVQRCTFRQPVQAGYAFPVTLESRVDRVRSLLGDFTIVQTGQPVIVKLLAERKQVIQEDCETASSDPLFHKMLAHYGGMRAQVVTPFIVGDELKGVLSVHELRNPRKWTNAEKALAAEAAVLIGTIFNVPQPGRS